MRAAVLHGPRDLRIEEVADPLPPPGWALIRTAAVGICGTDKAFYTGAYPLFKRPLIPGHEAAGHVVEGPPELRNKLVVPEINFPCWRCPACKTGLYTHCPSKRTLGIDFDGALAELFVAPIEALHRVEGLDPVVATEVEPLAALINALRQAPPDPSGSVAVIGTGNLALLLLQLLRWKGFEPVVFARPDSPKLKLVERYAGEVVAVSEAGRYAAERTRGGLGFDAVFEVSGDPDALNLAVEVVRPRGVIHLKSTPGSPGRVNATRAVVKEARIVGTRCGNFEDFDEAIRLLEKGIVRPVITHTVEGLDGALEAFSKALDRSQVKVVVRA
ncbi:MAG: alcohol dehydrogenase catalytic domain-containing protein [Thermofilum sp.]